MRCLLIVALLCGVARADEDKDLALIPDALPEQPTTPQAVRAFDARLPKCDATTGAEFYSAHDDWMHLTERAYDLFFFPRK